MKYLTKTILIAVFAGVLSPVAMSSPDNGMHGKEMKEKMLERFNAADADKNGVITHAEMMAKVSEKFGEFDKNKDGFLELEELPKIMPMREKHMRMKHMGKHHENADPEKMAKKKEKMKKRWAKKHTRIKFIAKLDKDGDERVSLEEFARKKVEHFKRGDENGDGSVTLAEMEAAGKHMRHHRMKKMKKHHKMTKMHDK